MDNFLKNMLSKTPAFAGSTYEFLGQMHGEESKQLFSELMDSPEVKDALEQYNAEQVERDLAMIKLGMGLANLGTEFAKASQTGAMALSEEWINAAYRGYLFVRHFNEEHPNKPIELSKFLAGIWIKAQEDETLKKTN